MVWFELDKIFRDEDDKDKPTKSAIYTATVPEYLVVFIKPVYSSHLDDTIWNLAKEHAVVDIQYPCRYLKKLIGVGVQNKMFCIYCYVMLYISLIIILKG